MLRFCCEKCGCKISVQNENAGMKAKCPKCNSLLVIPEKSKTIDFVCQTCGQKISVLKKDSGTKGHCPKCKNTIIVPGVKKAVYKSRQDTSDDTNSYLLGNDQGLTMLEVPDELKLQNLLEKKPEVVENTSEQELDPNLQVEDSDFGSQRRLPWFIDIFLYPTSFSGSTHLAIFLTVTMISTVLGLVGFILRMLMGLYIGWYFTECVRDSAKGNVRAPEAFASMGISEMWAQMQHIVGPYLLFLTPAFFYNLYTHNYNALYWSLLITGSFFFPMSLLACIMFDSAGGLNPILLIGSIFSTFFQYCGLVLLVIGIVFSFTLLVGINGANNVRKNEILTFILDGVFLFFMLYIFLIIAHLIGRFYWRNEEKLNWEC